MAQRRETYLTASGYTRAEIREQRRKFAVEVDGIRKLIEAGRNGWDKESLPEWYAGLAARLASGVVFDLRHPREHWGHGSRYYASMAQQAARAAIFALGCGWVTR